MRQRGRKSAESLVVVRAVLLQRPEPPADFDSEEAQIWRLTDDRGDRGAAGRARGLADRPSPGASVGRARMIAVISRRQNQSPRRQRAAERAHGCRGGGGASGHRVGALALFNPLALYPVMTNADPPFPPVFAVLRAGGGSWIVVEPAADDECQAVVASSGKVILFSTPFSPPCFFLPPVPHHTFQPP